MARTAADAASGDEVPGARCSLQTKGRSSWTEEERGSPSAQSLTHLLSWRRLRYRCPRNVKVGTLGRVRGGSAGLATRGRCAAFERAGER